MSAVPAGDRRVRCHYCEKDFARMPDGGIRCDCGDTPAEAAEHRMKMHEAMNRARARRRPAPWEEK